MFFSRVRVDRFQAFQIFESTQPVISKMFISYLYLLKRKKIILFYYTLFSHLKTLIQQKKKTRPEMQMTQLS